MAAVSSGEVTWNRRSVLALMKHSEHDPERFATNLVQASSAQESADCSALTGYEHCQACAMPAVTQLVTELVNVKDQIWTDQNSLSNQAQQACSKAYPADRPGGAAKCCSGYLNASSYAPQGFAQCGQQGSMFSPAGPTAAAADLKYNPTQGFYFDGRTSSMVTDCCSPSSMCSTNDHKVRSAEYAQLRAASTAHESILANNLEDRNLEIRHNMINDRLDLNRQSIGKICMMSAADEAVTSPAWPLSEAQGGGGIADAKSLCVSGQIPRIVASTQLRSEKLVRDGHHMNRAVTVIQRVINWLQTSGGTSIFATSSTHDTAPAVLNATTTAPGATVAPSHDGLSSTTGLDSHWTGMVSLLESAQKDAGAS